MEATVTKPEISAEEAKAALQKEAQKNQEAFASEYEALCKKYKCTIESRMQLTVVPTA